MEKISFERLRRPFKRFYRTLIQLASFPSNQFCYVRRSRCRSETRDLTPSVEYRLGVQSEEKKVCSVIFLTAR